MKRLSRRQFARNLATGITLPCLVPATVFGADAPSNRITVGCIGTGNQGFNILRQFLKHSNAQVVAVCDVNRASYGYRDEKQFCGREPAQKLVNEHYAQATQSGQYKGCAAYHDFRELVARDDIDAISLATPDATSSSLVGYHIPSFGVATTRALNDSETPEETRYRLSFSRSCSA